MRINCRRLFCFPVMNSTRWLIYIFPTHHDYMRQPISVSARRLYIILTQIPLYPTGDTTEWSLTLIRQKSLTLTNNNLSLFKLIIDHHYNRSSSPLMINIISAIIIIIDIIVIVINITIITIIHHYLR